MLMCTFKAPNYKTNLNNLRNQHSLDFMCDLVNIDAAVGSGLGIITVSALPCTHTNQQ